MTRCAVCAVLCRALRRLDETHVGRANVVLPALDVLQQHTTVGKAGSARVGREFAPNIGEKVAKYRQSDRVRAIRMASAVLAFILSRNFEGRRGELRAVLGVRSTACQAERDLRAAPRMEHGRHSQRTDQQQHERCWFGHRGRIRACREGIRAVFGHARAEQLLPGPVLVLYAGEFA